MMVRDSGMARTTYFIFATTTYCYTIFFQQPGIIKIPYSKLDRVRYPKFSCENKMECKQTVGKFSRKMI
jgi:hypothetical protein